MRRAMMVRVSAGSAGTITSPATITFDHTKAGSADTPNFVALFSTTDLNFRSVANGGNVGNVNDFRFTDSGGSTLVTWEIIKWVATTGEMVANVNIGTLSHTVDTVIKLLFDGTSRGSFLGGSVGAPYDANYKTVIVGGDGTTLDLTDHTSNANNGTNNGTGGLATATAGPGGLGAISFDATKSQFITTPNTINVAHPTFEAWAYLPGGNPGSTSFLVGLTQGNGSATTDHILTVAAAFGWYLFTSGQSLITGGVTPTAQWVYLVGTADGTTQLLYVNGVQVASVATGNAFAGYTAANFQINGTSTPGGALGTFSYTTSQISNVRVSDIARSASYVLANYNNVSSPTTFYTVT